MIIFEFSEIICYNISTVKNNNPIFGGNDYEHFNKQ